MNNEPTVPSPDPWVIDWLSAPRLARYLTDTSGDPAAALLLYEWNSEISVAFLHDLAHLEVGLRNAYDRALTDSVPWPGHWVHNASVVFAPLMRTRRRINPATGTRHRHRVDINAKPRNTLIRAVDEVGGSSAPPGKVIAQLMFGFWRYLSSSAHDATLWRNHLYRAFPAGTSRDDVDQRIGRLHDLRNRAAHHESLIDTNLPLANKSLLELAGIISPELHRHIAATSRVHTLLTVRP